MARDMAIDQNGKHNFVIKNSKTFFFDKEFIFYIIKKSVKLCVKYFSKCQNCFLFYL